MKACVITIGNEILKGRTVNTNAAYIGKFLTTRGYEVERGLIVKDSLDEIKWAIDVANGHYDLVVTTGGLGPTFDDMTVEGVSRALGLELTDDPGTLDMLIKRYRNIKAELTPERMKLARVPKGAIAIKNTVGSAPGVLIDLEKTKILILPGVPKEMEAILSSADSLIEKNDRFYYEATEHLTGVMESSLAPVVSELMEEYAGSVYIKSHPLKSEKNEPELDVEVSAYAQSSEKAKSVVCDTMEQILEAADEIRRRRKI